MRTPHTHILTTHGVGIYEHGTRGDEAPYLLKIGGRYVCSSMWDIDDAREQAIEMAGHIEDIARD